MKKAAIERFLLKIDVQATECWDWSGTLYPGGYGMMWAGGKLVRAHRFAYEYFTGCLIPEHLEIDHLCRNRRCVNPSHLEAVTHQENCRRGEAGLKFGLLQRAKTHCPQGHPYDDANIRTRKNGKRECKICYRGNNKRRWLRRKMAKLG